MNKASLAALASLALVAAGCRPSTDRTEAQQAGQAAAGIGAEPARPDEPVKRGANTITEETLPTDLATAGTPDRTNDAGAAADVPAPTIPAQYRGRWGMVPADCTSTRGDAKGLIRIGERTIRFYEATATLKEQRPAIATSFGGNFAFTGEGQTWEKDMTLTRNGDTLTRAEPEGTFTYRRCAS